MKRRLLTEDSSSLSTVNHINAVEPQGVGVDVADYIRVWAFDAVHLMTKTIVLPVAATDALDNKCWSMSLTT